MFETPHTPPRQVLTVCLSAGFQRTCSSPPLQLGEINRLSTICLDAAGKGINVSRVLHQLGIATRNIGQGGSNQSHLEDLARTEGLKVHLIPSSSPLRTCTTLIEYENLDSDNEVSTAKGLSRVKRVTELIEPSAQVDSTVPDLVLEQYEKQLAHSCHVVISGSSAPGFPEDFHARLTEMALRYQVPVILDIRGPELLLALRENPLIVKINLSEFLHTFLPQHADRIEQQEATGSTVHLQEINEVLTDLTEDQETVFILTRGPRHVLLGRHGKVDEIVVPTISDHKLVNPIGSGDAFAAGLAFVLVSYTAEENSGSEALSDELIQKAVVFGIACAQSNALTLRPGLLDPRFLKANTQQ